MIICINVLQLSFADENQITQSTKVFFWKHVGGIFGSLSFSSKVDAANMIMV